MGQIKDIADATAAEQDLYFDEFGWSDNPFVEPAGVDEFVVPDEADIADVAAAIQNYVGPVLIHSRYSGAGKTTLLRVLLEELGDDHTTTRLGEHNVTPFELVSIIADEIGVGKSTSTKLTEQKLRNALGDWDDDPILLGIDEFGLNDPDTIHTIQFLSDIGMKVVMTGMSEQWEAIGGLGNDGRAFQRRVSYQLELDPLTRDQTREIVQRRLAAEQGASDPLSVAIEPFTEEALDVVHAESKGIPGVIVAALAELVGLGAYRYGQSGELAIDGELAEAIEYAEGEIE